MTIFNRLLGNDPAGGFLSIACSWFCCLFVLMKIVSLVMVGALMVSCSPQSDPQVSPQPVNAAGAETAKAKEKPVEVKSKAPAVKPGEVTGVEMGQLFTMLQSDKVHLVDVRPPIFFHLGHIDGAVNFPLKKYESSKAKNVPLIEQAIKSGKVVVLYCQNVKCPDASKTLHVLAV